MAFGLDSRRRGNDRYFKGNPAPNDTTTQRLFDYGHSSICGIRVS